MPPARPSPLFRLRRRHCRTFIHQRHLMLPRHDVADAPLSFIIVEFYYYVTFSMLLRQRTRAQNARSENRSFANASPQRDAFTYLPPRPFMTRHDER